MIDLNQVLTFSEAAQKWGFANGNTLRKAVERKKFMPDEIRKSGDVWLTTYTAMLRVFGTPRTSEQTISFEYIAEIACSSLYDHSTIDTQLNAIFQTITDALEAQKTVTILESEKQPNSILTVIKTQEDMTSFKKRLKLYLQSMSIHLEGL